jgi:hypothetical protein
VSAQPCIGSVRRRIERLDVDRRQDAFELTRQAVRALLGRPEAEFGRHNDAGADRVVADLRDARREPIYVGQTNERLRSRIRRHLTNQRTDAVAMSVLDPFEVFEIEVWPLPNLQDAPRSDAAARQHLDALERLITERAVANSQFKAILNEKDPPPGGLAVEAPTSLRRRIVSERVHELRSHPDFRLARRALILSRLAQVISERKVQGGLRRVLLVQAKRLQWLAARRYDALGGAASVPAEGQDDPDG